VALPHQLAGHDLIIGASIGIAISTGGALSLDELNKHADLAMYQAKKAGRNTFRFFSPEIHASVIEQADLERDLRVAIATDDFFVRYQPQVDVSSGQIVGVEALLRWQHAELGLVSPARFIPMAEEARSIGLLGEWILRKVCMETELLRISASKGLSLSVSVNISSVQFQQEQFVETIKAILEKTKAIISLGNNLGLRVIAEGVETKVQAEFLQDNQCTFMQGYLFGQPMAR
jgi:predicted signal transduction protein with EAL and GGDEF domain